MQFLHLLLQYFVFCLQILFFTHFFSYLILKIFNIAQQIFHLLLQYFVFCFESLSFTYFFNQLILKRFDFALCIHKGLLLSRQCFIDSLEIPQQSCNMFFRLFLMLFEFFSVLMLLTNVLLLELIDLSSVFLVYFCQSFKELITRQRLF